MRIVSLNAWGGALWPALAAWVPAVRADVLCLQEVTQSVAPGPDWLRYVDDERALDQRSDLFADVSALLPGHRGQFCAAAQGPLRDAQGGIHASLHGIATWIDRGLTVTGQVQGFAHGAFRPDGWGAPPVPRALHILRIHVPRLARHVVIGHLHGLRDPDGKGDTPARVDQARRVVSALATLRAPGDPVILAGDLNILPGSATFAIMREIGLTDLVIAGGHRDTRTSHYRKSQRHADYLLVSPEVPVRAFDVPALPEVSDHRPLILDIG
ncbi:MAG: endonuclease/exonuclease/phosphatase family protein [Paracoccaceae bacterium]|nr:MAG: endonuclease/exonuclease/phosphatase family protein [Paracoccaceae bacterium]